MAMVTIHTITALIPLMSLPLGRKENSSGTAARIMKGMEGCDAVGGTFGDELEGQFPDAAAEVLCLSCTALYFGIDASFGFYLAQAYVNLYEGLHGGSEGCLSALSVLEGELEVEVHAHGVVAVDAFHGFG